MSNRTTKSFETPNGHKVVILDYITGREAREIAEKKNGETASSNDTSDRAIKITIVSLDGDTNDILNRVLELPLVDFSSINDEIANLIDTKKK